MLNVLQTLFLHSWLFFFSEPTFDLIEFADCGAQHPFCAQLVIQGCKTPFLLVVPRPGAKGGPSLILLLSGCLSLGKPLSPFGALLPARYIKEAALSDLQFPFTAPASGMPRGGDQKACVTLLKTWAHMRLFNWACSTLWTVQSASRSSRRASSTCGGRPQCQPERLFISSPLPKALPCDRFPLA